MLRNIDILKNRKVDYKKLIDYGFKKNDDIFIFCKNILNDEFRIEVTVNNDTMTSRLIEIDTNEEFLLVDISDTNGEFVGRVKSNYDTILNDIINKCTNPLIFKEKQTKDVIKYVKEKYNDDLNFLWEKFPENAIFKHRETGKWYGIILTVKRSKLEGIEDDLIEILDLKCSDIGIVDNKKIFPGYHMNKKHWITIILDGRMDTSEIYKLIDVSYNLK